MPHLNCHPYAEPACEAVQSIMRLTSHATHRPHHGASRMMHSMFSWSVKTLHAPSRLREDARVYGHMTTTVHDMERTFPIECTPPDLPRKGTRNVGTVIGNRANAKYDIPPPRLLVQNRK